jgi:hypothetical protein
MASIIGSEVGDEVDTAEWFTIIGSQVIRVTGSSWSAVNDLHRFQMQIVPDEIRLPG